MKFVTVATEAAGYYPSLLDSCKRHGCDLTVLGWGQKWKGFAWRFELIQDFLETQSFGEIVAIIDAYDVVILQSAIEIEKRFRSIGVPILFSYDDCVRKARRFRALKSYIHHRRFPFREGFDLSAGMYMGYAGELNKFIDIVRTIDGEGDDQRMIAKMTQSHPHMFHLDHDSRIMFNFHGGHIKPERLNTCILHGPGHVNLDPIITRLRLEPPLPTKKISSLAYHLRFTSDVIGIYLWEILFVITVIALIIYCIVYMVHPFQPNK